MDEQDNAAQLDDFQVIAERLRLTEAIAALTARYRELNQENDQKGDPAMDAALTTPLQDQDTPAAALSRLPASAARMAAVEILLADPETLGDDVLEACLYVLREKLRAAPQAPETTAAAQSVRRLPRREPPHESIAG